MKTTDYLQKMCLPAKIYLAILIISIILAVYQGLGLSIILFKTVFGFIWMWILNWICSKGYTNLSWVILLIPYVMMFLIVATTIEVVNLLKSEQIPVRIPVDTESKDSKVVILTQ